MVGNYVQEQVTIMTETERIEGTLFHMDELRLSDFLNHSSMHEELPFLKIKNPQVFCRRTGQQLAHGPFLMVARNRIVLVLTKPCGHD
jgi:hypothetical protein